mmetsp:Transcript_15327/g.36463  ORF Transcript_15327/g.36463 Transcript_15327/m.36463 type:complete len:465 (-) Transcript_15327:351-1745(-)
MTSAPAAFTVRHGNSNFWLPSQLPNGCADLNDLWSFSPIFGEPSQGGCTLQPPEHVASNNLSSQPGCGQGEPTFCQFQDTELKSLLTAPPKVVWPPCVVMGGAPQSSWQRVAEDLQRISDLLPDAQQLVSTKLHQSEKEDDADKFSEAIHQFRSSLEDGIACLRRKQCDGSGALGTAVSLDVPCVETALIPDSDMLLLGDLPLHFETKPGDSSCLDHSKLRSHGCDGNPCSSGQSNFLTEQGDPYAAASAAMRWASDFIDGRKGLYTYGKDLLDIGSCPDALAQDTGQPLQSIPAPSTNTTLPDCAPPEANFFLGQKRKRHNLEARPGDRQRLQSTEKVLTWEKVSSLFNLTIEEAAAQLGVCTTLVKRACRKHGVVRWPGRKYKALLNDINKIMEMPDTGSLLQRWREHNNGPWPNIQAEHHSRMRQLFDFQTQKFEILKLPLPPEWILRPDCTSPQHASSGS